MMIIIASQLMLYTLDSIDKRFIEYQNSAVESKVISLKLAKDLNYISRCTRDIMLGNDYDMNIAQIKERIYLMEQNYATLFERVATFKHIDLQLLHEANKSTMAFVYDGFNRVLPLKDGSDEYLKSTYLAYKSEATPLANEARKHLVLINKVIDEDFVMLSANFKQEISKQRTIVGASSAIFAAMMAFFIFFGFKNILKHIQTENELAKANSLLLQYKYAMDLTNIVSKTDQNGTITYVNDEFCKISQYTADELLNSHHGLVRHPKTKSDVFSKMWQTIKSKKVWHGIIENKKKDGTSYFVDTTIVPILNAQQNIEEYIAIRKDVTEMVNLNKKLAESQHEILSRLGMIAESRSKETSNHVRRVAEFSRIVATKLGMSDNDIELLYNASALHDIGKVATPDAVLLKPSKLTPDEFEIMKMHSVQGYEALKGSSNEIIQAGAIIAYEHHEKFDGSGYPRGLKGDEIHIFARIVALADVFDALGSPREYKKAWAINDIILYINAQSGKHFDPELVEIFNDNTASFISLRKIFKCESVF